MAVVSSELTLFLEGRSGRVMRDGSSLSYLHKVYKAQKKCTLV